MEQKKHETIDQFCLGCALLIFTFNTAKLSTKDIILRNFLAKAVAQLRSVTILNSAGNTFDCFILYRAMVDRLAHIYYLHRTKSFQMFDDWSFMRQYEANHNSLSDPDFKDRIDKEYFQSSETDKARYKRFAAHEC